MTRKFYLPGTVLALFLIILLASGCSKDSSSDAGSAELATSGKVNVAESGPVVGPRQGNLAPNFKLQRLDGGTLELGSLKGKAVLIDFWDTWCPPCRKALPHLQEISETYSGDLVVVGVAMGRDGADKVRSYVAQNELTFEFVLADAPQYTVMRDFGGVQSIPTTFLLDREGVIHKIWTGAMPKAEYEKAVRQVLGV